MQLFTPLRYPGGKGKLAPYLVELFRFNHLCDGLYVEPYAGGAAVALSLLLTGHAGEVVINDIDPFVYAFWWAVLNDTETLCHIIQDTPVTMETWHAQKKVHAHPGHFSRTAVGFATFFLNRTNRSGILKAGVIGGQRQNGPYTMAARYNKENLIKRIKLIATYRCRIHLHNADAFELVNTIKSNLPKKSLFYFDPPYFVKGCMLYKNSYSESDHRTMAACIRSLNCPWIVTYDNVPEICEMFYGESSEVFDISYSAHMKRPRGAEVLFYRNISLPCAPYARHADSRAVGSAKVA